MKVNGKLKIVITQLLCINQDKSLRGAFEMPLRVGFSIRLGWECNGGYLMTILGSSSIDGVLLAGSAGHKDFNDLQWA